MDVTSADLHSGRDSSTERDLILNGHARLPITMDFTTSDAAEVRELFISSFEDIQPINNTLEDVKNASFLARARGTRTLNATGGRRCRDTSRD